MKKYLLVIICLLLITGCHKTTSNYTKTKINGSFISIIDNYVVYKYNNKLGIKDLDGKTILEPKYQELLSKSGDKSLIFKDNGNYILVDKKGNEIFNSKNSIDIIKDNITNREYYVINNGLYNDNYQLLIDNIDINSIVRMYNGFIITSNNRIIDIRTRRALNISFLEAYKDYTAFIIGDSYLLYDHEHETWIPYNNYKKYFAGSLFSNDNDTLYISYTKGRVNSIDDLIDPDNKLSDLYYIDKVSNKLINKSDNKAVLEQPLTSFDTSINKKIYYFEATSIDNKTVYLSIIDNKSVNVGSSIIMGNYLLDKDNKVIYDSTAKKVNITCDTFKYVDENYICNNSILDSKLNVIKEYTSLNCNDKVCSIEEDNKYGIFMNNKVIVKPVYDNIDLHKDYYVGIYNKSFEIVYYKNIKDM
jgi:hypothetical protein